MRYLHTIARASIMTLAIAGAGYCGTAAAASQASGGDDDVVFEAEAAPFGNSYSQWTAKLWQRMLSIPAPASQFTEGVLNACWAGQGGPVWFLVGKLFVGGTTIRSCTVPADKALFFPVYNSIWINTPNICGQGAAMTVKELRGSAAGAVATLTNMSVEIDGKSITGLREHHHKSQVFEVALPEDNIFNQFCGGPGAVPGGIYAPSVDDGYYLMLKPLSEGGHTLRIRSSDSNDFVQDVTYQLTVLPKSRH